VDVNGKKTRRRIYPRGAIDIQDENCSDFIRLKTFISLHMQDLKDATNEVLYENYRSLYLSQVQVTEELPTEKKNAEKLLQMKEEEIRRMQEQLMAMKQVLQLQTTSGPNSGAQSVESISPLMSPKGFED